MVQKTSVMEEDLEDYAAHRQSRTSMGLEAIGRFAADW